MEIKSNEITEVKQKISKEIDNEQLCKNDSNSIDSDIKNKNTFNPKIRNSEEIPYNSDNKSTSVERPDKSDDLNQQTQSSLIDTNKNNNYQNTKLDSLKLSKSNKKNVEIPHKFYIFLERNEGFQKRQKENINELKRNVEDNIKKSMKEKPEITKKSRIIDKKNSKQKFLDRIQDEANKYKQRKEKLFERINLERAKKKEEIEKPLEFNTKLKEDKKFMKAYESMMERQKEVKNRFKVFNEVLNQYNMKECTFAPKINKHHNKSFTESADENNEINKNNKFVKRLYNDEIKNRIKKKENLVQKYKPSFHPKINKNAESLSRNWKLKLNCKTNYY